MTASSVSVGSSNAATKDAAAPVFVVCVFDNSGFVAHVTRRSVAFATFCSSRWLSTTFPLLSPRTTEKGLSAYFCRLVDCRRHGPTCAGPERAIHDGSPITRTKSTTSSGPFQTLIFGTISAACHVVCHKARLHNMLHVPIVRDGTRMVCFIIHSPPLWWSL